MRRIALAAALIALLPATYSYLHTILEPSNSSLGVRSVEWLREHGAAGLVSQIESIYYSLTAPSKGGASLRALPQVGYGAAAAARAQRRASGNCSPSRATALRGSRHCSIRRSEARASGAPPVPGGGRAPRC